MADKKSLFAGRSGDNNKPAKRTAFKKPDVPPPPPTAASTSATGERKYGRGGAARGVAVTAERRAAQMKEADEYRKQANKCLQKTMTRWNPNFFSAAPLFEKAAACYRAAGEDGQATAMFMQAGECQSHDSVMAHASAGKDFREAALITERQGREDEAAALYLRCAEAWVHADESGRAAEYLGRSARLIEGTDEDAAAERYIHASKVMVPAGSDSRTNFVRVVGSCDILVQGIRFLASVDRFEECMEVVERYCIVLEAEGIEHSLGRMYLTYCVLALTQGDYVKANTAFANVHLQSTSYLRSEECRVEEELLTAFKDFNSDLLRKAQDDRTLRRLETAIVKLAKSLRIPGDEDQEDIIPVVEAPSGTIGDARARVGALKAKYGGATSSSSLPPSPSPPTTTASFPPNPKGAGGAGEEENLEGKEMEPDRGALFGGARKASPPMASQPEASPSVAIDDATPSSVEGDVDLGDLEASLGGGGQAGGEGEDDDLDAIIEAARREAEALELGEEGVDGESSEEEDLDLT